MLKIRGAQMRALEAALEPAFVSDVAEHVRALELGDAAELGGTALLARVRVGLARGKRAGLTTREGLRFFVSLLFDAGPGVEDDPRVRALLGSDLAEDERLRRVHRYVYFDSIANAAPFPVGDWDEV